MTRVHQAIKLTATEHQLDANLAAERPSLASQRADRHVLDAAAFDQRDDVLTEVGPGADVDLTPPEAMPKRAKSLAQPDIVHPRMVTAPAHPPLTCRILASGPGTLKGVIETTWAKLAALRLRRQHLERRAPRKAMLDVVRDHVAVQAQVIGSAELAIHARVERMTRDDVKNALWRDRTLVKTWAMRGTLHLVASDELPELVAALGTRINWLRPVWLRYFEVSREEMLALQDGIGDVLTDIEAGSPS